MVRAAWTWITLLGLIVHGYADGMNEGICNDAGVVATLQEAEEAEGNLQQDPDSLALRHALVNYYFQHLHDEQARQHRQKHVLWLIEYRPDSEALSTPEGVLFRSLDGDAFKTAESLWREIVSENRGSSAVATNEFVFMQISRLNLTHEVVEQLHGDESSHLLMWRLGQLCVNVARRRRAEGRRSVLYEKSVQYLGKAVLQATEVPRQQLYRIDYMKAALAAGQPDLAAQQAEVLLEWVVFPQAQPAFLVTDAYHQANTVLGSISLDAGDVREARRRLLEAAVVHEATPSLLTFGPNMMLAKHLLEKGEKEAVLEYLRRCRVFWVSGRDKIDVWIKMIHDGETPDFGANLYY